MRPNRSVMMDLVCNLCNNLDLDNREFFRFFIYSMMKKCMTHNREYSISECRNTVSWKLDPPSEGYFRILQILGFVRFTV